MGAQCRHTLAADGTTSIDAAVTTATSASTATSTSTSTSRAQERLAGQVTSSYECSVDK